MERAKFYIQEQKLFLWLFYRQKVRARKSMGMETCCWHWVHRAWCGPVLLFSWLRFRNTLYISSEPLTWDLLPWSWMTCAMGSMKHVSIRNGKQKRKKEMENMSWRCVLVVRLLPSNLEALCSISSSVRIKWDKKWKTGTLPHYSLMEIIHVHDCSGQYGWKSVSG